MALKDRLNNLRRQAGSQQPPAKSAGASVAERMQRCKRVGEAKQPPSTPLDELLGGTWVAPGLMLLEEQVPLSRQHGTFPLSHLQHICKDLPEAQGLEPQTLVFIDTETTGLSGGTGTVAFLVGLARLNGEALTIRQYLLTTFAGERALLAEAGAWLADAQALVSFNGKSFDLPLLLARCRLAGMDASFRDKAHVDLLYATRRAYATRWPDCRMATVEQQLLGFVRENDLPGSEAPAAWFSFMHAGDAGRLPGVAQHNRWDLVSLAALLPVLDQAHASPGLWRADVLAVARAHLRRENHERAYQLLLAHAQQLSDDGALELAALHRRRREWDAARAIWEGLAEKGCAAALEGLAKYYEHQRKDYPMALKYAAGLSGLDVHEQRRRRLEGKMRGDGLFSELSE